MKPVIVIGHRQPDTDAICSAICYADLKQKMTNEEYLPCRAGQINCETRYVLQAFGVEEPMYLETLERKLSDVSYRKVAGIDRNLSIKRAWEYMSENDVQTLAVLDEEQKFIGIVTLGDIARFYLGNQDPTILAQSNAKYRNIVDVLNGTLIIGNGEATVQQGKIAVFAANPDIMEEHIECGDLIILGNRYESQVSSIEMQAGCLIVCLGSRVSKTIRKLANEANCAIVTTPLDTYTCAKLINQAVPVQYIMRTENLVTFCENELVSDVKRIVSQKKMRYFPILSDTGNYIGMVSQRSLLSTKPQQVILVDHNEREQAAEGIHTAEILEIIDHHRVDPVEASNPIYFRNQPLGSTATIIALIYQENGIPIEPTIAGLMCSAILSDTQRFQSPTCTETDQVIAKQLARIAGIDMEEHAEAMLRSWAEELKDRL